MSSEKVNKCPSSSLAHVSQHIDWNRVPSSLIELKRIAGEAAALSLVFAYGGCRIYMPSNIRPNHPLATLMGSPASKALAKVYGGSRINIPKKDAILRQLRIKEIQSARSKGASIDSLARKHNLSRRRVQQLLAQARSEMTS